MHVKKPNYEPDAKYLIVIRNPVSRALSAFNWRYKLIVEDRVKQSRLPGEDKALVRYQTFNKLAERLFCEGELSPAVAEDYLSIGHLKEDISYYLKDLLDQVDSKQIYAVLTQEYLDADIKDILGVVTKAKIHANRPTNDRERSHLSDLAMTNLRKFLRADYDAIAKINMLYPLEKQKLTALMR